jgi:hypothetical protein
MTALVQRPVIPDPPLMETVLTRVCWRIAYAAVTAAAGWSTCPHDGCLVVAADPACPACEATVLAGRITP